jgi:hypothetical protein
MPARVYLPLLPIPALALLVAVSCSRPRTDEPATRVIPPPSAFVEPAARNAAEAQGAAAAVPPAEEPPTAEEVRAFERPVAK